MKANCYAAVRRQISRPLGPIPARFVQILQDSLENPLRIGRKMDIVEKSSPVTRLSYKKLLKKTFPKVLFLV